MAGGPVASLSRLDRMWVALPLVLLVVCAVLVLVPADLPTGSAIRAVVACVAVAAWHGWWVLAHPHWLEARLLPMAVYFVGLLALTDYLTSLSFIFFLVYITCYPMAFVALPGGWAYAGVAATAVVSLAGTPPRTWTVDDVVLSLGAAALASLIGWAIRTLETETARRRAAMAELGRTHADLERALAANLALQDRLLAEARDAGMAAERTRLAGEIHDTLAAGLAGIVSQLEALDAQLGPDHPLRDRVQTSTEVARESLRDARRSVRALRPASLDTGTLPAALGELLGRFERHHHVVVHRQVTGEEAPLPAPVEDALLKAANEALTNVARHANATAVHVTLSFLGDAVALDVADDGTGSVQNGGGHGLAIMRERVGAVGGDVAVETAPGAGTTITATVPLDRARGHDRS